jgi:hypothetical protein
VGRRGAALRRARVEDGVVEQGLCQEVLAGKVFARLAGGLGVGVRPGGPQGREGSHCLESLAGFAGHRVGRAVDDA